MKTRYHNMGVSRETAYTITEVTEWDSIDAAEPEQAFNGKGFYFWDETGAHAMGPYETLEGAVEARGRYAEGLDMAHLDLALLGNAFFHISSGTWMDPTKVTLQKQTKGENDDQNN